MSYSLWPMDCSPPGSFAHGIFQTRILEWLAISSSRGSSQPRDQTCVSWVSCIGRQILYHWATQEPNLECTQCSISCLCWNSVLSLYPSLISWLLTPYSHGLHCAPDLSAGASAFCQSPFQELQLCWASPWSWLPPFLNSTFHLPHLP